ncbi:substrate-binding periplasmic protein [Azospirillum doebereinerae]|uniref:substrate-binding periplasmic protein n=1 Tax=Azospirillum doebereinerae TaxID=92933 RepID=UPI001EE509E7|nr:transporter substrate-binding domain-containing protein [Azospirillum doebereinerae]
MTHLHDFGPTRRWTGALCALWLAAGLAAFPIHPASAQAGPEQGADASDKADKPEPADKSDRADEGRRTGAKLDLVTGTDFAPFTGDDLPNGGLITELVQRAFAAVGQTHELRFIPWRRGYDGVVSGRFLATFPYVRTPERERDALFSEPVITMRQLVYLSAKPRMAFNGPADFRGRVVCAPGGYALPAELDVLFRQGALTRETPSSLSACVRMVALGRADAFVINEHAGNAAVAQAEAQDSVRAAEKPYAVVTEHLIVGRGTPGATGVIDAFNAGLKILKESGAYDETVARHTAIAPPKTPR